MWREVGCCCSGLAACRMRLSDSAESAGEFCCCPLSDGRQDQTRITDRFCESYGQSNRSQALALADVLAQVREDFAERLKADVAEINTDFRMHPRKQYRVDLRYEPTRCELMSITGAGYLGQAIRDKINAAKQEVNSALTETDNALGELNTVVGEARQVAKQVKGEADALRAELGQLTNGGPQL